MKKKKSMMWYDGKVRITTEKKYADLLREVYQFASKHSSDISTFTAASLVDNKGKIIAIASKLILLVPPKNNTPIIIIIKLIKPIIKRMIDNMSFSLVVF